MQIEINVITSIIVLLMMLAVAKGYAGLITVKRGTWGYYMMRGVFICAVVIVLRSSYWDLAQFIAGDRWMALRESLGGQRISVVFNLPMIWAAYYFLCSRWVLIPENERHRWRWWNAWLHPSGTFLHPRAKPPFD